MGNGLGSGLDGAVLPPPPPFFFFLAWVYLCSYQLWPENIGRWRQAYIGATHRSLQYMSVQYSSHPSLGEIKKHWNTHITISGAVPLKHSRF